MKTTLRPKACPTPGADRFSGQIRECADYYNQFCTGLLHLRCNQGPGPRSGENITQLADGKHKPTGILPEIFITFSGRLTRTGLCDSVSRHFFIGCERSWTVITRVTYVMCRICDKLAPRFTPMKMMTSNFATFLGGCFALAALSFAPFAQSQSSAPRPVHRNSVASMQTRSDFASRIKRVGPFKSCAQKYFSFAFTEIEVHCAHPASLQRGGSRSSRIAAASCISSWRMTLLSNRKTCRF